jgi:nucleotide-binding universal stress UspA family protein
MADWLRTLSAVNPLSHQVDGLRARWAPGGTSGFGLGALLCGVAVFVALAAPSPHRCLRSPPQARRRLCDSAWTRSMTVPPTRPGPATQFAEHPRWNKILLSWRCREREDVPMRLLVATDGSLNGKRAVAVAARLARELRAADVTVVHVGRIPLEILALPETVGHTAVARMEAALEQTGRAILRQAAATFRDNQVRVSVVYRRGDPAGEIVRAAQDVHADLIVVGARGVGRIGGLVLGSVSERVLHASAIPVAVVH